MALAGGQSLIGIYLRRYGLVALWVLSVVLIAIGGSRPGEDFGASSSYPLVAVLILILLTAAETALLFLLLRPMNYCRSWPRTLLALAIFRLLAVSLELIITDQPGFLVAHVSWLNIVCMVLLCLFLVSAGAAVRIRMNGGHE